MVDLSARVLVPELIDAGNMPEEEVRRNLQDIRRINRVFGSRRVLLEALQDQVRRRGLTRFRLLDIASGSCDLPIALLNWAEREGLRADVFALEYWWRYLALFQPELSAHSGLHLICADALCAPVAERAFDFVTCSHFLHHLTEDRAVQLLRAMTQWARYAVLVNDLARHPIPYHFFRLLHPFFTTSFMTRRDGLASFRQAFRRQELEQVAECAGLENFRIERRWPFRLLLVVEVLPLG